MIKRSAGRLAIGGLAVFAITAVPIAVGGAVAISRSTSTIDGTYELTKHVMPNGAVIRPPAWAALYTMDRGRFSLNLFFGNPDGTLASESSIGRYTFTSTR